VTRVTPTLVLLAVPPLLFLAWRVGLLGRPSTRRIVGLAAAGAILWALPWQGLDLASLKRLNLLLAAAAALFCLLRGLGVPWAVARRPSRAVLGVLAALSLLVHWNFFAFHGARTFVHYHDVVHYYLGAKYFPELGYTHLYTAMLRAEAETNANRFQTLSARDLATNEVVHIVALLRRSDPVKAAFPAARWEDFKRDAAYFREALGPAYAGVLQDHGFNPTPLWALLGGALARLVPAGDAAGIRLLTLLDPLLLLATFGVVARVFAVETALLVVTHYCVIFGAGFAWTGGAFLRYLWLACVVGALASLRRRRHAVAGALLALATGLRVFPAAFVAGVALKALGDLAVRRRAAIAHVVMLVTFAATGALLLVLTAMAPRGIGAWHEFRANTTKHLTTVSPNLVGLTALLAYREGPAEVTAPELREIQARRASIYRAQVAVLLLPALLLAGLAARRAGDPAAMALGIPLLFVGLNLAAYYYAFLVLLTIVCRDRPWHLLALFGLEVASHTLLVFEERDAVLFIYRDLLVLVLLAGFAVEVLRRRLRPAA
jgi:hypothetical protein